MPGAVFLRGDAITLRTIEEADVEFLRDGINDPEVRAGLLTALPINGRQEEEFFEERVSSEEGVNLLICADGDPAGAIGLHQIDERAGHCEVGLWLAPEYHGRGYGTEASRLAVNYAFEELRMHRVQARVLDSNEASRRIWETLGFEREGVHRDEAYKGGEYRDVHYYGALESEWSTEP